MSRGARHYKRDIERLKERIIIQLDRHYIECGPKNTQEFLKRLLDKYGDDDVNVDVIAFLEVAGSK